MGGGQVRFNFPMETRDAFEVWKLYFERLTMAAESGLLKLIGTPIAKKFGFIPETGLFAVILRVSRRGQEG